jgi:uncharacterized membrane protein YebE (DUF533 family)
MLELQTIEIETLDNVTGGVDYGMAHTVLTQALSCAGGGALIGGMTSGPVGAGVGAVLGGAACGATSYLAMKQQEQQSQRQALPQAQTPTIAPR